MHRLLLLSFLLWSAPALAEEGLGWGDILDTVCEDDFLERLQSAQQRQAKDRVAQVCASHLSCLNHQSRRLNCCRTVTRVSSRRVQVNGRWVTRRVRRQERSCTPTCLRAARRECRRFLTQECIDAKQRLAALVVRHGKAEPLPQCKEQLEVVHLDSAGQEKLREGTKKTGPAQVGPGPVRRR